LARDAEAPGGDLLDRAAAEVSVGVGHVARGVLAALAGVRAAADAVHRDRERLVRLLADRSVRHRAGGEAPEDGLDRLDLVDRNAGAVGLELHQAAQRRELLALVIADLRELLERAV